MQTFDTEVRTRVSRNLKNEVDEVLKKIAKKTGLNLTVSDVVRMSLNKFVVERLGCTNGLYCIMIKV